MLSPRGGGVRPWFTCSSPPASRVSLRRRRRRARRLPPKASSSSDGASNVAVIIPLLQRRVGGGGRRGHADTSTTALAAPVSWVHLVLEPHHRLGVAHRDPPQGRTPPPSGRRSPPGTSRARRPIPPRRACTSTSLLILAHSLTMSSLMRSSYRISSWIVCAFFHRSFRDEHGASSAPLSVHFRAKGLPTGTGCRRCVGG